MCFQGCLHLLNLITADSSKKTTMYPHGYRFAPMKCFLKDRCDSLRSLCTNLCGLNYDLGCNNELLPVGEALEYTFERRTHSRVCTHNTKSNKLTNKTTCTKANKHKNPNNKQNPQKFKRPKKTIKQTKTQIKTNQTNQPTKKQPA